MDLSEYGILFFLLLIVWVLIIAVAFKTRNRQLTISVNAIIQAVYLVYLFYNLEYNSSGGVGIVWMFLGLVFFGVHAAVLFIWFLFKLR
jgi:hypothetical protein